VRRISSHQQAGLFLKPIHGLFFAQPVDGRRVKEKLVAYPLAYDYGLFTSIFTYPNLLTLKTS
jgi:hypothetical protein